MEDESLKNLRHYQKLLNNNKLNVYDRNIRKKEKAGEFLNFLGIFKKRILCTT